MSDSDSSSDGEDVNTTGLIATRAKRTTAGNLYATLRQNLDDEELQKELLAEDEEDQGDYEGSDKDDDDAMSSSGDEDDAGPPKEGEEDLEGEKELKRQERAALKKKRKMDEAKMRLPAWQKKTKKKVKLADDAKAEDGQPARPKKKSERSNWLPTAADMPTRQSSRSTAVANREMVTANLKVSNMRSEQQKKIMARHHEKVKANARAELTQEERFAKAAKIEKETAREFGRWEREEAERQRIREEQLAAKRKRGIDGPVIRHWSGSVLWEGDKIKDNRLLHGSQTIEQGNGDNETSDEVKEGNTISESTTEQPTANASPTPVSVPATPGFEGSKALQSFRSAPPAQLAAVPPPPPPSAPSWLDGIYEYASRSGTPVQHSPYTPSAPAINTPTATQPNVLPTIVPYQSQPQPTQPPVYHGFPPVSNYNQFAVQTPPQPPPPPPAPLIKQQAQRSLLMLEQFEHLETTTTTSKRGQAKSSKDSSTLDPTPVASTLLPLSYPTFTDEESRYLTAKFRKTKLLSKDAIPPAPNKVLCALTSWPAKFRDPKTALPYAGLMEYKMIQRLLAGGCQWSAMLGAWTGPAYGGMGRPARGVPEGFGLPIAVVEKREEEGGGSAEPAAA